MAVATVFTGELTGDFELEDLISPDFYHQAVLETYPAQPVAMPAAAEGKRTRLYETAYKDQYGFGFNKRRVGETVKKLLIEGKADETTIQRLTKLTSAIREALHKQCGAEMPKTP